MMFDYENGNNYSIRVRVEDSKGATYEKQFTICINDLDDDRQGYWVAIKCVAEGIDYNFMNSDHHFMTLIDHGGTLNLRPHPGVDPDGWGSSLYLQPFLSNAVLQHTNVAFGGIVAAESGISIAATGKVSHGLSDKYGSWELFADFQYNRPQKIIAGIGSYTIDLAGELSSLTGDLNLYKIASNYLDNVPLLGGIYGDTGDLEYAEVAGSGTGYPFNWSPPVQPQHFPIDITDLLSIDCKGNYYNVNSAAQGYDEVGQGINAAYKPSLKVVLSSQHSGIQMIFGGFYDMDGENGKKYWLDNVGITPLILKASTRTEFDFNLDFESKALPGDGS